MRRNLVYFVCPIATNDEWRRNVATLTRFLPVFDHRRLVTIAQGPGLDPAEDVRRAFPPGVDIEFVTVPNDPRLGEAPAFVPALRRVASQRPDEITFYGHAKGVTPDRSPAQQAAIRRWRDYMYVYCLADPFRIEWALQSYACCGCFKKHVAFPGLVEAPWHFSGTFFWFANARLFSQPGWDRMDTASRYAVEGYLGRFFANGEAFCLFGDLPGADDLTTYRDEDWMRLYERDARHGPSPR